MQHQAGVVCPLHSGCVRCGSRHISTYNICNNIAGYCACSNTSGSGVMEHVFPKPFRYVEFRVSAVNGAGQGSESSVVYEPSKE